jgi:hypothetical protein
MNLDIEWTAEDSKDTLTLGHASKLKIDGCSCSSPLNALTKRDLKICEDAGTLDCFDNNSIIIAGESLAYTTFMGVGSSKTITEGLYNRIKEKMLPGKINIVHPRIPRQHIIDKTTKPVIIKSVTKISEIQTSALVGIQLEAGANFVVPPLPSGLESIDIFRGVYNRTKTEIQSSNNERPIIGYIPTMDKALEIIPEMIKTYIKDDVKVFAVDFSSSNLNRWLIRTVVTAIRSTLKIKRKVGEDKDKQYYLHIFNVAPNKKSQFSIAPITDVLTHAYGVDSTSGVIWGGGQLKREKLRFYNMQDYGAYQLGILDREGVNYDKKLVQGGIIEVYENLRAHRLYGCRKECENIAQIMSEGGVSGYAPHLSSKLKAKNEVKDTFLDVKEIIARCT